MLSTLLENSIKTTKLESNVEQSFDSLFSILTTEHTVSLEDIELVISQQGQKSFDDRN